jgi:hypothetical protein
LLLPIDESRCPSLRIRNTREPTVISEIQARFIRPEDRLWEACLAQMPHDFYHKPGYLRLCADQEGGQPLAFVAETGESRFFVPLVVRPIDSGRLTSGRLYDATSPYGYPSPLLRCAENGQTQVEFLEEAIERLLAGLRQRGIVSLFLRLHPLLPLPPEPFCRHGMLVHHGETVFVDLTLPEEELWHQTRKEHRRKINRAKRNGCVAEVDHAWSSFDEFFDIYTETMRRVGATDYYFFDRQYFHDLKDELEGALHLGIARVNGSVACAGLFTEVCGIVQFHLSGLRPEYSRDEPVKLMVDFVRRWAKERGNRAFHLGGGVAGQRDSLFQFKSGFSKLRGDFHTWRAVVNADAYQALVAQWQQRAGVEAEDPRGFFPAYRRPLPKPSRLAQTAGLP